jgi:hypothetical protein
VQTSLNLALGSAMASIGLTIPTMAVASIWLEGPLVLGLGGTQMVLFTITAAVGALTVLPGRATVQEGGIHLALFALPLPGHQSMRFDPGKAEDRHDRSTGSPVYLETDRLSRRSQLAVVRCMCQAFELATD